MFQSGMRTRRSSPSLSSSVSQIHISGPVSDPVTRPASVLTSNSCDNNHSLTSQSIHPTLISDVKETKETIETKETKETKEMCPICQDNFEKSSKIRTLKCKHCFHEACINKWIEMRNLCPLCNIVADEKKPVRELRGDDEMLSRQLIASLIEDSINSSSANFWGNLLGPMSMMRGGFGHGAIVRTLTSGPNTMMVMDDDINATLPSFIGNMLAPFSGQSAQPSQPLSFQNLQHIQPRLPTHDSEQCGGEKAQCACCYDVSCIHKMKRCGACRQIRYCSPDCQREHWGEHRTWCMSHRNYN